MLLVSINSQPANSVKRKRQTEKEQQTSKILVKNIPFQANVRELRELFRVFGELKFVDFMSKNDAKVKNPPSRIIYNSLISVFAERFRSPLSQYTFVRTTSRPRMG
jgi:RNA recognition motif-containing protein